MQSPNAGEKDMRSASVFSVKNLVFLQVTVVLFSLVSVLSKLASGQAFFSARFLLFFGAEFLLLAVYAILWQQVIKRFPISVAYANKAMVLLWGLLWGVLFFREKVTPQKILGIALVIGGVFLINRPTGSDEEAATQEAAVQETVAQEVAAQEAECRAAQEGGDA